MAPHHATSNAPSFAVLPAEPSFSGADEIHHRVANSLQLLAAMVSIETRRIADPAARHAFERTIHRISAIGGVHRQLYQTHSSATVDLAEYLLDLGADLDRSWGDARTGRRVLVQAQPVVVASDDATAVGVIVSEIVCNACKYAYLPGAAGDIEIALRKATTGYILEISDRGRGIDPLSGAQGTGLGGRLVVMMADRLGAQFDWQDTKPGTRFTLRVEQSGDGDT